MEIGHLEGNNQPSLTGDTLLKLAQSEHTATWITASTPSVGCFYSLY
jgi:hypothetical protein